MAPLLVSKSSDWEHTYNDIPQAREFCGMPSLAPVSAHLGAGLHTAGAAGDEPSRDDF